MTNNKLRMDVTHQIHALNSDYVEQLIEHRSFAAGATDTGQSDLIDALALLDATQRHDLCATPYTLFYLPFDRPAFWREAFFGSPATSHMVSAPYSPMPVGNTLVASALVLAWMVGRSDPGASRLLFGMTSATLELFQVAGVAHLLNAVQVAAASLQPRWATHPHFWPDLVNAAREDALRLHATRLLGAQLLAAEICAEDPLVFRPAKASGNSRGSRRDDFLDNSFPSLSAG